MQNEGQINEQSKIELDECLTHLAYILQAIGVEELTIEHDYQYHLINEQRPVNH